MTAPDLDKLTERIALLLRKAESTTPEEAEALTQHAERLMLRHGIERARAEAAKLGCDVRPEEIVTITMELPSGHYSMAYALLAQAIANAYGPVRVYRRVIRATRRAPGRKELRFVGYQHDAEAVRTLAVSLLLQGRTAMDAWHRRMSARGAFVDMGPSSISKAKRDYLVGFGQGAAAKLRELRTVVHAEAEADVPGTAVALLDRQTAVDRYVANIDGLRSVGTRITNSAQDGHRDGRNANVGGPSLAGPRRSLPASAH